MHTNFKYSLALLLAFYFSNMESVKGQTYTDIAPQIGLDVTTISSDNFGSGVSFFDFDQNGWDDLTFTADSSEIRMFRNLNGTLSEVDHNIPQLGALKEVVWFDYDKDGLMDLLTSSYWGKCKLYKNMGDFQFTDVSVQAGLFQVNKPHYGIEVGDYNKDGFLDFYVSLYAYVGDDDDLLLNNQLYRNNGNGTFTNVTFEAGVGGGIATSFDAAWMDYNEDGWPDLYVINDRQPYNNIMYENNGDGTFSDVTDETNTGFDEQDPMTVSVCDFDNDGDLDLYQTNTGSGKKSALLVNDGSGHYTDLSIEWGVQHNYYSWGALWVDRDNDGKRDLYVATSPIGLGMPVYKDLFYNNMGDHFQLNQGVLTDLEVERSYGLGKGDLNNDGYADIVTQSISPYPANLWLNSGGVRNYVKITLQGTASNTQAIGSWIRVYAGGNVYTEYTRSGDNYVSQNSQHLIFGLGSVNVVDSLTVLYPSGYQDSYYNLAVNEHHYLTEGETYSLALSLNGDGSICDGDSVIIDAGTYPNYFWNTGDTTQTISVFESGEFWVAIQNEFGVVFHSDTLEITVNNNPSIQYEHQNPLCHGDHTGHVFLQNASGVAEELVIWSNGNSGTSIDSLAAGLYTYTFIDVNGCEASGEVLIQEPMGLSALIYSEPDAGDGSGSLWLILNGGTPPYEIYLDGVIQDSEFINELTAGSYALLVTDHNGCELALGAQVAAITGQNEIKSQKLQIFPNPVSPSQTLTVDGLVLKGLLRIEVYDLQGAKVWEYAINEEPTAAFELPSLPLASGQYQLRFHFINQQPISRPLMISDNQ